ncbi:MAG: LPXTG cell wall anchor domain-containing protein, partial [Staphylococcus equorum]
SESLSTPDSSNASESLSTSDSINGVDSLSNSQSMNGSESMSVPDSLSISESFRSSDLSNMSNSSSSIETQGNSDVENEKHQDKVTELPDTGEETTRNGLLAGIFGLGGLALLGGRRKKQTDENK